mmetsp:Transcript_716/g.1238  ORF Transcript_716/g.1238 Transcript_716/m.1238 type:complete len:269 (-) Transcript_716:2056-2862(-)
MGLLVILLELLHLMLHSLMLQLLFLTLLLVAGELVRETSKGLIQVLQLRPHVLEVRSQLLELLLLLLQLFFHLLQLLRKGLLAFSAVLVLALHGQKLVSYDLQLHLRLLGLLPLLLELLHVLLRRLLQLHNLLLKILGAILTIGVEVFDVLLQLLRGLLQLLFLLGQVADVGGALLDLRPHLLNGLLGRMVLTATDAVHEQGQLVLLAFQLAVCGGKVRGRGLNRLKILIGLVVGAAKFVHLLLQSGEFLELLQQVAALRCRATGQSA